MDLDCHDDADDDLQHDGRAEEAQILQLRHVVDDELRVHRDEDGGNGDADRVHGVTETVRWHGDVTMDEDRFIDADGKPENDGRYDKYCLCQLLHLSFYY